MAEKCAECRKPFDDNPGMAICKTCADWLADMENPDEAMACTCGNTTFREDRFVVIRKAPPVPKGWGQPVLESVFKYTCTRCNRVLIASEL